MTDLTLSAIENGPWTWQSGQFYSTTTLGYTPFYRFCDYVEVSYIYCFSRHYNSHRTTYTKFKLERVAELDQQGA